MQDCEVTANSLVHGDEVAPLQSINHDSESPVEHNLSNAISDARRSSVGTLSEVTSAQLHLLMSIIPRTLHRQMNEELCHLSQVSLQQSLRKKKSVTQSHARVVVVRPEVDPNSK